MKLDLLNRKNVIRVKEYLSKYDPNFKLIVLDDTARTANEAAQSINKEVGAIIKSLIFKTNENEMILCLVSGDKFISLKKVSLIINKKITKASAEEVKKYSGFSIGGVPPVAHNIEPMQILIDKNLERFEKIYGAAGHPYVIFETSFNKLCEITKGKVSIMTEIEKKL